MLEKPTTTTIASAVDESAFGTIIELFGGTTLEYKADTAIVANATEVCDLHAIIERQQLAIDLTRSFFSMIFGDDTLRMVIEAKAGDGKMLDELIEALKGASL